MTPQERADRLGVFREELATLESEGALELTSDQRAGLDAYVAKTLAGLADSHDVDTTESERHISLGVKIASALGGLALCVAVVLFFQRYLGTWPTELQAGVLATLPIGLTVGAEFAARRERTLYYAALLSIVAFAAFVANLALLGAIFNMAPTPNALLVWGLFGLALAYHFGLRIVLAAGLVSLLGWVIAATNLWRGWWWWEFERRPEELIGAGLLLAVIGTAAAASARHARFHDFPQIYRLLGLLAIFFPMLYLSADGLPSYLPWEPENVKTFYQMAGVVVSGIAVWIGVRQSWSEIINTGTLFFAIFLFFRLVEWWWDAMPTYLFFLLIGGIAIGLVAIFKRLRARTRSAA